MGNRRFIVQNYSVLIQILTIDWSVLQFSVQALKEKVLKKIVKGPFIF